MISSGWWENNQRNGQGNYHYVNGDSYEGEWKDNKRQGKGVYTCAATKLKVCYPLIKELTIVFIRDEARGRDFHVKGAGMLVEKFGLNP